MRRISLHSSQFKVNSPHLLYLRSKIEGDKNVAINEVHHTICLIDEEIRNRKTGTPIQLAGRLCMSVRLLYYYLGMMETLGAIIYYSKSKDSFVYAYEGYFEGGIRWIALESSSNL